MQTILKFSKKNLTLLGLGSILFSTATLNAQQKNTPLEIIRSTSSMIDQAVEKDLTSSKLKPFPIINDATFLRRTYINIIGRIPTHQETTTFLSDKKADKRATLIDSLVYSPGHESTTFNYWADLLRLRTNDEQYGLGWHIWLRESVAKNKPFDKMVYEMLSASGHITHNQAAGYYLRDRNMLLDNISNSVQVFLGTQIGCAQCHDHPFEDWTQKQYYELAAFGANIDYKSDSARQKIKAAAIFAVEKENIPEFVITESKNKNKNNGKPKTKKSNNNKYKKFIQQTSRDIQTLFKRFQRNEISLNTSKTLKLPADYQYNDGKPGDIVSPNPIFTNMPDLHQGPNRLENFAKWVTDPSNPQFTKTIANRLWAHVYGYGLAEPLDNWTDRTKVSHPEALAIVEKILKKNNYNIRETLRILYHTQLFQRTVSKEEVVPGSTYAFQGPILRRLSAEELHDSFLTLEKGNVDGHQNGAIIEKWNNYKHSINSLLAATPENILKIDDLADKTEEKVEKLKAQAKKLKIEMNTLLGKGSAEKAKELKKQISNTYKEIKTVQKEAKSQATSDIPMAASMVEMAATYSLRVNNNNLLRASEQPSPSNGGSFLNRFGASDRKEPNAAHTAASIPQTLTLLNGKEILSATDKKGTLPNLIANAKSPKHKLNILFTTIYSRYPSQAEIEKYTPYMDNNKQIQVLAKAMLNSKRFLFLQ